jgi:hypothetical protein
VLPARTAVELAQAVAQRTVTLEAERVIGVGLDGPAIPEPCPTRAAPEAQATSRRRAQAARAFGNGMRVNVTGCSRTHTHLQLSTGCPVKVGLAERDA